MLSSVSMRVLKTADVAEPGGHRRASAPPPASTRRARLSPRLDNCRLHFADASDVDGAVEGGVGERDGSRREEEGGGGGGGGGVRESCAGAGQD